MNQESPLSGMNAGVEVTAAVFDFRHQCWPVSKLLDMCQKIIPMLPVEPAQELEAAMRLFEEFGVSQAWSSIDVDRVEEQLTLTEDQKRDVVDRYVLRREDCTDDDWFLMEIVKEEVYKEGLPEERNHVSTDALHAEHQEHHC